MQRANEVGTSNVLRLREDHNLALLGLDALTAADELKIVQYYTSMLASSSVRKLVPSKVVATAITFLQRFYLDHSNMEHDALRITLTCLYIACKVCFSLLCLQCFSLNWTVWCFVFWACWI